MTPEEAAEKRAAVIDELTRKWHARDCGCDAEATCPIASRARHNAESLTVLAGQALRKRGWF